MASNAPANSRTRGMAEAGRDRALCLLCCPDEHPGAVGVPALCDRHLEAHASAAQSKGRLHLGSHRAGIRTLAPQASHPSSLARCALRRHTPEVGAQCPNRARWDLCGGRPATGVPTAASSVSE